MGGSLKKKDMEELITKSPAKKKSTTTSEEGMKTRVSSSRDSLDSLMAGFQIEGRAKTALGMPLKDFSESATALLMSNYKVENEKVLSTTALAMSSGASESKDKTLSSLERFQQFFTEEKTSSLLSPKGSRLLGHAEDLNVEANAALQALLLLSTMNLSGKKPSGSSGSWPLRIVSTFVQFSPLLADLYPLLSHCVHLCPIVSTSFP